MFKMADIRESSLAAHAAAREVKENDDAARSAARAAGQAVATAHVPAPMPSALRFMQPPPSGMQPAPLMPLSGSEIGNTYTC